MPVIKSSTDLSIEAYEELTKNYDTNLNDSKEELYQLLEEGRTDVLTGRTRQHKEVMADLKQKLKHI